MNHIGKSSMAACQNRKKAAFKLAAASGAARFYGGASWQAVQKQ
jgi:hypothetical protein